jgi:hypothetical protein
MVVMVLIFSRSVGRVRGVLPSPPAPASHPFDAFKALMRAIRSVHNKPLGFRRSSGLCINNCRRTL